MILNIDIELKKNQVPRGMRVKIKTAEIYLIFRKCSKV